MTVEWAYFGIMMIALANVLSLAWAIYRDERMRTEAESRHAVQMARQMDLIRIQSEHARATMSATEAYNRGFEDGKVS